MRTSEKTISVVYKILVLLSFFFLSNNYLIGAASDEDSTTFAMKFTGILTLILIALILWLLIVMPDYSADINAAWRNFKSKLISKSTLATPLENENEILMDHEYDGIKELDNKVPPIFNLLFYGSMVFALIYMIQFHIIGSGNIQEEEYLEEIRLAEMERNILIRSGAFLTEETVTKLTDDASLLSGRNLYVKNCASCHAMDGGGTIGPNLADRFWIHGGGIKNIFKVIRDGVPQKGMISWQTQLAPKEMQELASYIMELEGTVPANPKDPEGKEYNPESEESI